MHDEHRPLTIGRLGHLAKFEKERRLREKKKDAAEEKEKGIPKPKTIPISRACDFYERSRKMAFALEERKRAF